MNDVPLLPTFEQIGAYEWEEVAARATPPICHEIASSFFSEATSLEESGDATGGTVYRLLGQLAFMAIDSSNKDAPITPAWVTPSRRSAGPQDLEGESLQIVRQLFGATQISAFRARLGDILWIRQKDFKAATQAAADYLATFKLVDAADKWAWDEKGLVRGMDIARTLGKKKPLFLDYVEYLTSRLHAAEMTCDDAFALHLLQLLADHRIGDHPESARIAESIGDRLDALGSFHLGRCYYDYAIRFFHLLNDLTNAHRVIRKKGESLINQANREAGTTGFLTATSHLAQAVECLQQGRASAERIDEVHRLLLEWQSKSTQEMKTVSKHADVAELVEGARKFIEGKSLQEALFVMSLGHSLIDPELLRKRVLDNLKKFPFASMFGASVIDRQGRIQAHRPSGFTTDPKQQAEFVESEMFHQATTIDWNFRAQVYIDVCRTEIWTTHRPELHDLEFLVFQNPLIPPGHEAILLKAILAGFRNDFDVVAHFLVPQVEEFIRHILTRSGHLTSTINSELIQQAGYLGKMLGMGATKQIFGEDAVFELRGILIEKFGYDLRNKLAHGFLSYDECWSPAVINLWWLMLRFVCTPVARRMGATVEPDEGSDSTPETSA